MKNATEKCVICNGEIEAQKTPEGVVFWTHGHNAAPVAEGQCCDACHNIYVLPKRLGSFGTKFKEVTVSIDDLVTNSDTL